MKDKRFFIAWICLSILFVPFATIGYLAYWLSRKKYTKKKALFIALPIGFIFFIIWCTLMIADPEPEQEKSIKTRPIIEATIEPTVKSTIKPTIKPITEVTIKDFAGIYYNNVNVRYEIKKDGKLLFFSSDNMDYSWLYIVRRTEIKGNTLIFKADFCDDDNAGFKVVVHGNELISTNLQSGLIDKYYKLNN